MDTRTTEIAAVVSALEIATDPAEVIEIEAKICAIEDYMRKAGLYSTAEIRPVNEARILARWRLGQLLAEVGRAQGSRTDLTSSAHPTKFRDLLERWGLKPDVAMEAQRLGSLPRPELQKSFAEARANDVLSTFDALITRARPYWYQENRKAKHQNIAAKAQGKTAPLGPFPLIYADPPWKFEIYSEKGGERTPDQHYPTLTDQEIIDFKIGGQSVPEIAHKDAALLMWCTSSNLERALVVFRGWGFTFKTCAVWDKVKPSLGLVFRNQHEILLYGTRGSMPGPQHQPPSVFRYERGEHSAKPPEVRAAIEQMYPDFDARTRLEIFARGQIDGWATYGFETDSDT